MPNESLQTQSDGPLLEARGVTVRFGPTTALHSVDFSLRAGEIHALMGENGAGKSSLIKCLAGVHAPAAGEIRLAGSPFRFGSVRDAENAGVATVFQEIGLIPHMSIAENICLGREPVHRFWPHPIRWELVRSRARDVLARLGLSGLDISRELCTCSIAVRQLVAIARAMDRRPRVLILDEPTSSLDRAECARLFEVLRLLRAHRLGIVLITHTLEHVEALADRVTVLRDGRLVGVHEARTLTRAALVSAMVGRAFDDLPAAPAREGAPAAADAPLIQARGIGRRGGLEHADLSVAPGEVVGLAGLLGSGRTETARLLFGADRVDRGDLLVHGRAARLGTPRDAIAQGIAMTPENRKEEGIIPSLSIRENIALALQARRGLLRRLSRSAQNRLASSFIAALGIKTRDAETPIAHLSGGNQQKALLARWMAVEPSLLILDEPTRGIDVAAKAEILKALQDLRARGMGIVFISSELDEVVRSCGRIVVMRDRRSVAELSGDRVSEHEVLAAISQPHA